LAWRKKAKAFQRYTANFAVIQNDYLDMRVFIALTYYRPHYSGLTIYTERLARALVERGHQVTVLTSRFKSSLPAQEVKDGVTIIRPQVLMRVSKGVIMPAMTLRAWELIKKADVVNLHVPQLDAAPISVIGRLLWKPVLLTYHCDLRLPSGFVHRVANQVSFIANHISAMAANRIVTNTLDYAKNSYFLKNYLSKVAVIPPPVELASITEQDVLEYRQKYHIEPGKRTIGVAARFATEKGVEYLIQALPEVLKVYPDAQVHFVGQYENVLGEELYAQKLMPLIHNLGGHWKFLGILSPKELAAFFRESVVTVLPSINSTESFGIVQIESMISNTPVIATDIPGVRQPVTSSGMGKIIPPRNSAALARALIEILSNPEKFKGDIKAIAHRYSPETIAGEYETLFKELMS
jgi:glycosyltransferase involved in cell wall biosynthesis